MRIKAPLIVGAGPAGCAAAITLARDGAAPLLIDRDAVPGDAICGGFLSWKTARRLASLGVDVEKQGARRVERLALFTATGSAAMRLPEPSWGLSRHALDTALRAAAIEAGARFEPHHVRSIDGLTARTDGGELTSDALFLASGKHDVRPLARPRDRTHGAIGLRLAISDAPALAALVGDAIELHLFNGGYCGIVGQERGRVNICMAVRKSRLSAAGGEPAGLLAKLGEEIPALGERLAFAIAPTLDAIGAVPYGWTAQTTTPGCFRLGDQAAVIPSLAGEGIDIALASGIAAARVWQQDGPAGAQTYQASFAANAALPLGVAGLLWKAAETPRLAALGVPMLARFPALARMAARLTRIA